MAKYDITYSCGHAGTVELFGKEKDRQRKISWYESEGLCPECYKEHKRMEAAETPLNISITFDAMGSDKPVVLVFGGNTMEVKDRIKSLGYRWGDAPTGNALGDILGISRNLAWSKRTSVDAVESEIAAAQEEFPELEVKNKVTGEALALHREFERQKHEKEEKVSAAISAIEKPVKPECYPFGRWNGKIYGSQRNGWSVYVDGNKVIISPEEKEQLESYGKKLDEYRSAVSKAKQSV